MHYVKLLGQRLAARDFDCQFAEFQVRVAIVNGFTSLGIPAMFGQHLPQLTRPSPDGPPAAVMRLAEGARDGQDVVVVLLTSHGAPGMLAVNERGSDQVGGVSDAQIRDFLAPLNNDRQMVIVQACYSGSLIPALAHPNRVVITAAAADRTSFGCAPDAQNTWFIRALVAEMAAGGSWEDVFARTRALVQAFEAEQGIAPAQRSNPQVNVGRAMRGYWTQMP